jgi:methyl-accepting chemotaxis protein
MRCHAPLPRVLLVLVVSGTLLLSACAVTNRMFRDRAAEERAAALLQLQLAVMRFADEYAARVTERVVVFQQSTSDPGDRLAAQSWLVSQATSAFTIAAGPNPELNAIDMLVFATLSRMVIEDRWVGEFYGARAEGLLAAHKSLEKRAWSHATALLSEAQTDELRNSIEVWHRENPIGRVVPFVHLEDFAFATSGARTGTASSTSIFSFLGIDPLSNLDPAVREIAQSRQLAERAVYYGQRAPKLISMEAQRLAFELAMTPESVGLLQGVGRIGSAAQTASDLAADLPRLVAEERAALIEQLTSVLDERQGQLQALAVELRSTLEAGGTTSDSVRETIAALDVLIARFERPPSSTGRAPARPFDVTEYTEALRQLGDTAQQLQVLLAQADGKAPALTQASHRAAERLSSLVDQVYWRLVQLVLVLVAAVVLGALGYRAVVRRWR